MENISKSHVVMLCFLLCLLIPTPFLSSNTRPTYLYFITNLLIIALGVESGLLSSLFSNKSSSQDKTSAPSSSRNYSDVTYNHNVEQNETNHLEFSKNSKCDQELPDRPFHSGLTGGSVPIRTKGTTICAPSRGGTHEKRDNGGYNYKLSTGSSSMPSLFFLGDGGNNGDTHSKEGMAYLYEDDGCGGVEEEEDEVINGEISGQELYLKAEAFIGNFYKQLKLQRQNSLKRIYGVYNNT